MSIDAQFIDDHMHRDPNLSHAQNSINILNTMSEAWKQEHPDTEVPEELSVHTALNDDKVRFFAPYREDFDFATVPLGCQVLVIENFANDQTWHDLIRLKESPAKDTLEVLYLQHDGVIEGTKEDIRTTLEALKNLKVVHYCGYYANYGKDLHEVAETLGIEVHEIY